MILGNIFLCTTVVNMKKQQKKTHIFIPINKGLFFTSPDSRGLNLNVSISGDTIVVSASGSACFPAETELWCRSTRPSYCITEKTVKRPLTFHLI